MQVFVDAVRELRFDDGAPVRAASGVAPLGDGWLVVQDDATHAAWHRATSTSAVRVLPAIDGHEVFSEAAGNKHLKPDLEVACPAELDGEVTVLLLGSGSTPARMRGVLVRLDRSGRPVASAADLTPLYAAVGARLGIAPEHLNLEGASRYSDTVRWFNRGNRAAGVPSASVDLPLDALVQAVVGSNEPAAVPVGDLRRYDLGDVDGVGLAVTDAVALPDGRVLVCAAAEDTPNAVDDGPVVGSALVLLDDETVVDRAEVPHVGGGPLKIEGLALREQVDDDVRLLAVVDADDPDAPSHELDLRVRLR